MEGTLRHESHRAHAEEHGRANSRRIKDPNLARKKKPRTGERHQGV
jgi:hypothetical protein